MEGARPTAIRIDVQSNATTATLTDDWRCVMFYGTIQALGGVMEIFEEIINVILNL
jgi:hypothetical protein